MQLSVKDVADNANMIINGYAYTKDGDYIRVLNLNCLNNAAVIYKDEIYGGSRCRSIMNLRCVVIICIILQVVL